MRKNETELTKFITQTYERFFLRQPTQAELTFQREWIGTHPNLTPDKYYFSFAIANESPVLLRLETQGRQNKPATIKTIRPSAHTNAIFLPNSCLLFYLFYGQNATIFFFLTLIVVIQTQKSYASHIIGGEITYTCVGGNNFDLHL